MFLNLNIRNTRGGSESIHTNALLISLIRKSLIKIKSIKILFN